MMSLLAQSVTLAHVLAHLFWLIFSGSFFLAHLFWLIFSLSFRSVFAAMVAHEFMTRPTIPLRFAMLCRHLVPSSCLVFPSCFFRTHGSTSAILRTPVSPVCRP